MRLSEQADETGKKSTFQPTDPPTASLFPVAPNRPRLIIMVLFAAFAVGGGLAYLLYQLKPVFSSPRQLSEVTGLPVLGAVNMIWLGRYRLLLDAEPLPMPQWWSCSLRQASSCSWCKVRPRERCESWWANP